MEVAELLQRFKFSEEETGEFSKEECRRSLIGRVFGEKRVNFTGLKKLLENIWPAKESFSVRELGNNWFQFVFSNNEDKQKVLLGKGWTFDQLYIILKEWSEDIQLREENFQTVEAWVQIWNIPLQWLSRATGYKIGKLFQKISDVLIPENGSRTGRHMKILVEIDLSKPLLRGTMLKLNEQIQWVSFRYENLAAFCHYCGLVGHVEKSCKKRRDDVLKNEMKNGQYGDWLLATTGRNLLRKEGRGTGSEQRGQRNFQRMGTVNKQSAEAENNARNEDQNRGGCSLAGKEQ